MYTWSHRPYLTYDTTAITVVITVAWASMYMFIVSPGNSDHCPASLGNTLHVGSLCAEVGASFWSPLVIGDFKVGESAGLTAKHMACNRPTLHKHISQAAVQCFLQTASL
jgi:hypothetical protein